jgi:MFS superfamily sulfate permease-like transporter
MLYFNVDHVRDAIGERARGESAPPKLVIIDLSAAPFVDLQSAHTIAGLVEELSAAGIRVQIVETRSSVRERFRREELDAKLGGINRFSSVADAVESFHESGASTETAIRGAGPSRSEGPLL